MPFPLDTDTRNAIAAGRIKDAYLVDLYLQDAEDDPFVLRFWNWPGQRNYPGTLDLDGSTSDVVYETMHGRCAISRGIRMGATLSSEPLTLTLDGSRSDDDTDIVGEFVDAKWHQQRVRVRWVMLDWDTGALHSQPHWEWRGLLDHRNLTIRDGEPRTWQVSCQGSLFRVRGRRLRIRSHEDQQRRSAGDMFYKGTTRMVGVPLIWARKPATIPGIQTNGGNAGGGVGNIRDLINRRLGVHD